MNSYSYLFIVSCIWLWCQPLCSQGQDIRFRRLSILEGLSQSSITTIVKDHQGFLWFGTFDGLNRYDGYQFRAFVNDAKDSTSISDNWIKSLFVSRTGNIWIGTQNGGVNCFDPKTEKFTSYKYNPHDSTSIPSNRISTLCEDADGTLWVGSDDGGLSCKEFSANKFNRYTYDSTRATSLSSNAVRAVLVDLHGDIWIGTTKGLCRLIKNQKHSGEFIRYNLDSYNPNGMSSYTDVGALCEDKKGNIFIGTGSGGLFRYGGAHANMRAYNLEKSSQGTRDNWITCIHEDRSNQLWIGTLNNGLKLFDLGKEQFYGYQYKSYDQESLGSNNVLSMCEDDAGAMWFGTHNGISCYDSRRKQFLNVLHQANNPHSVSNGSVRAFCEDVDGSLWVGTHGGGLNYLPRHSGTFMHFQHDVRDPFSISSDFIICMSSKDKNVIWIGTRGAGLNKFDKRTKKFTHFLHNPSDSTSLGDNIINCLDEDREGNLWIGTSYNGLDKLDRTTGKFVHYRKRPNDSTSFSGKISWCILVDSEDDVWIGTPGDGLNRFDRRTGMFHRYMNRQGDPQSLNNNFVSSIHEFPAGVIWIGTVGGGLNRLDKGKNNFTSYTVKEGFADNQVASILHDARGRLWLTTKCLTMFDPHTKIYKNFDQRDGILCGGLNQSAVYIGNNGRMYFGGTAGFVVFHPDSIYDNTYIPPVVLTSFRVLEKLQQIPRDDTAGIVLSYEENYFSFEFAALSFTAPEKNKYRYMLQGYDKNWISCGTRRYAAYTHIDPGDYVFQVLGSNNDDVWNTTGASIAIHIIPPYWRTLWFRMSALFVIVLMGAFVLHQRFKFLKQRTKEQQELSRKLLESQEEERKRIGAGLHDSIGQNLLVIKNLAVVGLEANKNRKPSDEQLGEISLLASQSLSEVREISYNLRPYHLDQLGLTGALRSIISRIASSSRISFSNDLDDLNNLFPKDQEINIFRIVQEAANNIIKHSQATRASIEVRRDQESVTFVISDNGIGFDLNRRGFGLTSMAERVRILDGSMTVKSGISTGTTITVNIPFGNPRIERRGTNVE